jgi:hypothetical protein
MALGGMLALAIFVLCLSVPPHRETSFERAVAQALGGTLFIGLVVLISSWFATRRARPFVGFLWPSIWIGLLWASATGGQKLMMLDQAGKSASAMVLAITMGVGFVEGLVCGQLATWIAWRYLAKR